MITGAHAIIYSENPEADRAFFRDLLELSNVDAGDGWLIFKLPPAELALHPFEKNDVHELYLICDDIRDFIARMRNRGVPMQRSAGRKLGPPHAVDPARRREARRLRAVARAALASRKNTR